MHRIASSVTEYLIRQNIAVEARKEEYIYGLEMFGLKCINYGTILALAYITKLLIPTIFFLLCFLTLRGRTGGFHAKTIVQCYVSTIGIYLFTIEVLTVYILRGVINVSIALLISTILIFALAPMNHKNLNLTEDEMTENRRVIRWLNILLVSSIGAAILLRINPRCVRFAVSGIVLDAVLLVIERVKSRWLNENK